MVDIVVGRTVDELEKYGLDGSIFIAKEYIKMENTVSLANRVFLDVNKPHIILIAGKRGQGKSYTLASIAESISLLPKELSRNVSILIFDTMGIFWTMKFPNYRDAFLLEEWGLKPQPINQSRILVPKGLYDVYEEMNIPVDIDFTLNAYDLSGMEWNMVFGVNPTSKIGIYINKIIRDVRKKYTVYNIQDILYHIDKSNLNPTVKTALSNYFSVADSWGLFSDKGMSMEDLLEPGKIQILDISLYMAFTGGWSIKNLVIGLISKKILYERLKYRKVEEIEEAHIGYEIKERKFPLVWIMIDEAHEALPRNSMTPASEPLIQIIREGRQPGISLVLATQQPGKIHTDVMTQSDIVISHRVTAKKDLDALNEIMRNFSSRDIDMVMNDVLPKRKGAALILDDKSEIIYPVQIKPRMSWHGGEDPSLIRKKEWLELLKNK